MNTTFTLAYMPTIGMDCKFKNLELDDRNKIRLQIWDLAGQYHFRKITKNLYKGATGIVLYMKTQKKTFSDARKFIKNNNEDKLDKFILILVWNKTNLKQIR